MAKIVTCPNCKSQFDITIEPINLDSSKYVWILDNGHGGIIDGVYQTAGKRSPICSTDRDWETRFIGSIVISN